MEEGMKNHSDDAGGDEELTGIDQEEEEAAEAELQRLKPARKNTLWKTLSSAVAIIKAERKRDDINQQQLSERIEEIVINRTPYFPSSLCDRYKYTMQIYKHACNPANHIENAQHLVSKFLPDVRKPWKREKVNEIDDPNKQVKEVTLFALDTQEERIQECLGDMEKDVAKKWAVLNYLGGMSQAESPGSNTNGTSIEAAASLGEEIMGDSEVCGVPPPGADDLLNNPMPLDPTLLYTQTVDTNKLAKQKLNEVANAWETLISKAKILSSDDEDPTHKINQSIRWMRDGQADGIEDGEDDASNLVFPNILAGEVSAAQPALMGLLNLIADRCSDAEVPNSESPHKTQVNQNQIIPPVQNRKKRIVDLCLDKPGRFHLVMVDFAIKLLFEMKPLLRKSLVPDKLDPESLRQAIAHIAKYLGQCFNLLGCGTSSFATGLTGTLAYIKVVQMHLDFNEANPDEKEFVRLKLSVSDRLPLMSKACFEDWIKKCTPANGYTKSVKNALEAMNLSLYGANGNGGMDEWGIPRGIRVLWELMRHHRQNLFGPNYETIVTGEDVDSLIASGTYGNVFSLKERDSVLKVPKFFSSVAIAREKQALVELKRKKVRGDEKDDVLRALPMLQNCKEVSFKLGGISIPVPSLELAPRGIPLILYLSTQSKNKSQMAAFIDETMKSIKNTLIYIHELYWLHLDITPNNFIFHPRSKRVILIDFNCAKKIGDIMKGFQGTQNFTHKDIFTNYAKKELKLEQTSTKYDYFGLALTLCALLNRGIASWDMHGLPRSLTKRHAQDALEQKVVARQNKAKSIIQDSGSKHIEEWLRWLENEGGAKKKRARTSLRITASKKKKTANQSSKGS